jgi:hypothetical protein
MNEELQKKLASLASKLGTTTEHLWGVLIRQAYIDGFNSLLSLLFCLLLAVATIASFLYLQRKYRNVSPEEFHRTSMWPPPEYARWLILGIVLCFCVVIGGNQLY